jgi:fructokinase
MKKPMVFSLGEVLWDLFPEGPRFGGAPANFACHAAILGGDVVMVSAVGKDANGDEAIAILQSFGIDTSLIQRIADTATGSVGVSVDAAGKPTFTIHEGSAWDRIAWKNELEMRVPQADAICFGTLGQRSEVSRDTIRRCATVARANGTPRIVDINLRPPFFDAECIRDSIALASILKFSDDELPAVCAAFGLHDGNSAETVLRQLLKMHNLDMVIMTCGANGAVLATPTEIIRQPGIAVKVVDTVGAGDAFTASFLLGLLQGMPHVENLRRACEIAAAVCMHAGAVPANTQSLR